MKEATDYSETSVQLYQIARRHHVEQNITKNSFKKIQISPCEECICEWYCLVCNLITVIAYYSSN